MVELVLAKDRLLVVKLEKLLCGLFVADVAVELPEDPSGQVCLPVGLFEEVRPLRDLLFNLCDTLCVDGFAVLREIHSD